MTQTLPPIEIAGRTIGLNSPVFVIAEMSANHAGNIDIAIDTIEAAYRAGADCVKLQTYTADTITLDVQSDDFLIRGAPPWGGRYLHDLYAAAHTPWAWHERLIKHANDLGMVCFSSPFDASAVDFLASLEVPAYKIASPEITDIPLIEKVAALKKPVILSTGVADECDILLAINTCRAQGNHSIVVLKCTSAYPTPVDQTELRSMGLIAESGNVHVGLSDHTQGIEAPIAAVALGARIIEKHLILSDQVESEDAHFSLDETRFKAMVDAVRVTEKMLGNDKSLPDPRELAAYRYRRSLFVSRNINAGETLTEENVRSVRPGNGLHPKYLPGILNRTATRDLKKGVPLDAEAVSGFSP